MKLAFQRSCLHGFWSGRTSPEDIQAMSSPGSFPVGISNHAENAAMGISNMPTLDWQFTGWWLTNMQHSLVRHSNGIPSLECVCPTVFAKKQVGNSQSLRMFYCLHYWLDNGWHAPCLCISSCRRWFAQLGWPPGSALLRHRTAASGGEALPADGAVGIQGKEWGQGRKEQMGLKHGEIQRVGF